MHFSHATILAALAANVLATPVFRRQIGGEAQACQGVVDGVTDGVGGASSTVLNKAAGSAKRWINLYRRQGNGAADACYDVVNNVDQGIGYTVQNVESGIAGDDGNECTGSCAVGNTGSSGGSSSAPPPPPPKERRQVGDIAGGVQAVANKAGAGAATSGVTSALENGANSVDSAEDSVGDTLGTIEADGTADTGAEIGNAIGSAIHGGATGAAPAAKRQLNKIASGDQALAGSLGLTSVATPVDDQFDNIDGVGTGGVGDAGHAVGNAIDSTLNGAANAA